MWRKWMEGKTESIEHVTDRGLRLKDTADEISNGSERRRMGGEFGEGRMLGG
jgi:hypothetical protein